MLRFLTLILLASFVPNSLAAEPVAIFQATNSSPQKSNDNAFSFFNQEGKLDPKNWYIAHGWANGEYQSCTWHRKAIQNKNGNVHFIFKKHKNKLRDFICPEFRSQEKYHYGRYETRMKAAKGSGLNTAFFTYNGPTHDAPEHDEIDFEFLGKDTRKVEVTYWRAGQKHPAPPIDLGFDASEEFATYAFEWRPESIEWFVNGTSIFKTPAGADIPIHPQHIFFSLWSAGKGMTDWLGTFEYQGPYSAEIDWVKFTPFEAEN